MAVETTWPFASASPAVSGSPLFQMAVPRSKLYPPHSGWASLVYTRTTPPGATKPEGKTNVGEPSSMSVRLQPSRFAGASPRLTISTYSSGSWLDTTPSKKTHAIWRSGPVGVGVCVGWGVDVGALVAVAVGSAVAVGDGEGAAVDADVVAGKVVGVGVGVGVQVGGGVGIGRMRDSVLLL